MDFRIADTFTASLSRLTGDEQKVTKTTAFDLQMNAANPGMSFHKLERAKDPNFWSVRVSRDIRLIVHRTPSSLLLCYVDHHDRAYDWAERRKLQTHPTTGAAQLVEIRQRVQEVSAPIYVPPHAVAQPKPTLFWHLSDSQLLSYGVPPEWLNDVKAANEDTLLDIADHLPSEAAEALLELATGGTPAVPRAALTGANPFEHPDAQRRFRVMTDIEELERALEFPWDKWTIFLHPSQRDSVERLYSGPARVSGSAGTGKTIVALHRAVHLARKDPEALVLLCTFSGPLANALRAKLHRLISNQPQLAERIDVYAMDAIGRRLYETQFGKATVATRETVAALLASAASQLDQLTVSTGFLLSEWEEVVDPWQVDGWEAYRDVRRIGRKTRLPEAQRALLWQVFETVHKNLDASGQLTKSQIFTRLAASMSERRHPPYTHVVVDEAQDISVAQLRFLAALGQGQPERLFFAGDLGQRIFQHPFSWRSLGVDIRGRAKSLRINYRTSHQIRMQADRLLGPSASDVDGNVEERAGTVSVFNGPAPVVRVLESEDAESEAVGKWLKSLVNDGALPDELAVFVRSSKEVPRAERALRDAGIPFAVLDERMTIGEGHASVCTMHLAKGLEYKAVAVMACDDEVIPSQDRIEGVTDPSELEEVYNTERHLLYVACTRARDRLHVSAVKPASEFLDDLLS